MGMEKIFAEQCAAEEKAANKPGKIYKCKRCGDETDDLLSDLTNIDGTRCSCGGQYKEVI